MSPPDAFKPELDRIVHEYQRRATTLPPTRDSLCDPVVLFRYQQRTRAILRALSVHRALPLADKKILDVGCGGGQSLVDFESWGARRRNLAGIDLREEAAQIAKSRLRCGDDGGAEIRTGNAAELPWPDQTFHIVNQSTVFTSILQQPLRRAVATEMVRVLRGDGLILWYDFRVNNPFNKNVRGVGAAEIRSLFPGCAVHFYPVTLAPPLARVVTPISWTMSSLLEKLRILNSHYLAVIRPAANPRSRGPLGAGLK
jgi:ubiquinone/menaquinone biosynthesis C-methylase UbiE